MRTRIISKLQFSQIKKPKSSSSLSGPRQTCLDTNRQTCHNEPQKQPATPHPLPKHAATTTATATALPATHKVEKASHPAKSVSLPADPVCTRANPIYATRTPDCTMASDENGKTGSRCTKAGTANTAASADGGRI